MALQSALDRCSGHARNASRPAWHERFCDEQALSGLQFGQFEPLVCATIANMQADIYSQA